jgi:hypothetical protein
MSAQEVQGLAELTFVDVLCNDGMNYRAIVLKNQDGSICTVGTLIHT